MTSEPFFNVINKMRWNLIEIRSCTISSGFNQGFLVISRSMNVLVDWLKIEESYLLVDSCYLRNKR